MNETFEQKFKRLKLEWNEETCFISNPTEIVGHAAHQAIISMGKEVLPLIFESLRKDYDFWFHALTELTGVDPILPEDAGHMPTMTQRWLDWGLANGYLAEPEFAPFELRLYGYGHDEIYFRRGRGYTELVTVKSKDFPAEILDAARSGTPIRVEIKYQAPEIFTCRGWSHD